MRENRYRAHSDSVGCWSNPEEAALFWNRHICPILESAPTDDHGECVISAGHGVATLANEWAWEEFCGRGAGDDESVCEDLAAELKKKVAAA